MPDIKFVLRDLKGVAEVEALLEKVEAHPNPEWAPEQDDLKPLVDRVSLALFGITGADTQFSADRDWREDETFDEAYDRWERQFYMPWFEDDQDQAAFEQTVWAGLGWDVTDGAGATLPSLGHFERQMVCATNGVLGRLPSSGPTERELEAQAEAWGKALLAGAGKGVKVHR